LQVQWLLDRGIVDIAASLRKFIDTLADVEWEEPADGAGPAE
jgi:hypothetical protein